MSESTGYLYRFTTIAEALEQTLDQFCSTREIDLDTKQRFLETFQSVFQNVMDNKATKSCMITGHLDTYQHLDGIWNFYIKDATLRSETDYINSNMLKIIALDATPQNEKGKPRKRQKMG